MCVSAMELLCIADFGTNSTATLADPVVSSHVNWEGVLEHTPQSPVAVLCMLVGVGSRRGL